MPGRLHADVVWDSIVEINIFHLNTMVSFFFINSLSSYKTPYSGRNEYSIQKSPSKYTSLEE